MPQDNIVVRGAKEHNLKNIDLVIPRDKLVVITGVSGSGKSSLAFDTIYAEGQRRYVESLSAYARQFLGRMDKPDVEYLEGLSPAISIDQKGVSSNPRSTIGTITEIYDYLRLLFARAGRPYCPKCGQPVAKLTPQQIVDSILSLPQGSKILLLAPKVRRRKGEHKEIFEESRKAGFVRVRVNGQIVNLDETDKLILNRKKWHYVEIVIDRLIINHELDISRITDSVETSLKEGKGVIQVSIDGREDLEFSEQFSCIKCDTNLPEIEPRTFSFNSPHGACNICTGLGYKMELDPDLILSDKIRSLSDGAIIPWNRTGSSRSWYASLINSIAKAYNFSTKVPVGDLPDWAVNLILYGNSGIPITIKHKTQMGRVYSWKTEFEGVIPNLVRRFRQTTSDYLRSEIERYMNATACEECKGRRLRPEALAVKVSGIGIMELCSLSVSDALLWVTNLIAEIPKTVRSTSLSAKEYAIAKPILKEVVTRLECLANIGLGYLTLERSAKTLSGGESQRIRLASQIGSGLTGVLYVCDEPTIGLHPFDDQRLIDTLKNLRDLGNTVIVVEHDEAIMRSADHIIDLGPGAGENGGHVVATGKVKDIELCNESITGQYLSRRKTIPIPKIRRKGNGKTLEVLGAKENNLKDIDVKIPLGKLVCVTGVSGSGKSSLVYEILFKRLAQIIYKSKDRPGKHSKILGIENIDKVINIDQSPIGRTPRSNPATYTGTFTPIRELFASLNQSKMRGYAPGRFSFNVKGGRCEECQGEGYIQVEMQFLPNVSVPCDICNGKRYNREALEIRYKEANIAEVLNMTVDTALEFFWNLPKIRTKLETMRDVGLGYIRLGQPATTLSGGEAQRIKLSTELSRRPTGRTLYLLDEPTSGLSFEDCDALLKVLHRLVDAGNSVILIEHHLDVIKNSDWVIDLGPGAANKGGRVVAAGTPEALANRKNSWTGHYLRKILAIKVRS